MTSALTLGTCKFVAKLKTAMLPMEPVSFCITLFLATLLEFSIGSQSAFLSYNQ